jgi:hypothetical protein
MLLYLHKTDAFSNTSLPKVQGFIISTFHKNIFLLLCILMVMSNQGRLYGNRSVCRKSRNINSTVFSFFFNGSTLLFLENPEGEVFACRDLRLVDLNWFL